MIIYFGGDSGGSNGNDWLTDNGTPYAAYQPKNAADFDDSLLDVSPNGRDIVSHKLESEDWSIAGWTLDGSADNVTLPFGFSENWTIGIKYSGSSGVTTDYLFGVGVSGSAPLVQCRPHDSSDQVLYSYGSGLATWEAPSAMLSGIIIGAGADLYVDGDFKGTASGSWVGGPTDSMRVGSRHSTIDTGYFAGIIEAIIVFNKKLDASEALTLYNGMSIL